MAFGWDDAIGIGASVLGFLGQEETNAANAQQASQQMDFQREMSSTAYQRAVTDMKAAGLNPMLAYSQGGATTPGGAMATMQNSTASAAANASQVLQQRQIVASTDNVRADTALKNSQALVNQATVPKLVQDTLTGGHSASQIEAMVSRLRRENELDIGRYNVYEKVGRGYRENYEAEIAKDRMDGRYGAHESRAMRELARSRAASAVLNELDATRGDAERRYFEDVGKGHFYTRSGTDILNSASSAAGRVGLRYR